MSPFAARKIKTQIIFLFQIRVSINYGKNWKASPNYSWVELNQMSNLILNRFGETLFYHRLTCSSHAMPMMSFKWFNPLFCYLVSSFHDKWQFIKRKLFHLFIFIFSNFRWERFFSDRRSRNLDVRKSARFKSRRTTNATREVTL